MDKRVRKVSEVLAMKQTDTPSLTKFRKINGGTLFLPDGKKIKPNEVFYYDINCIPEGFMDCLQVVEPQQSVPVGKKVVVEKHLLKQVEGGWNVSNRTGKVLNEEPLAEEDAKELLTVLNS